MGQAIAPVLDTELEQVKEQLALAAALRKQGMQDNGGAGYHGGRIYAVGNPWGGLAQQVAGQFIASQARERQGQLEQQQLQERQDWMNQMPSATETQHYDPVSNPGTGPLQEGMEVPKDPRALAQATQAWAMKAPRGMEGVQNFALQQAMTAPQRQAEMEQRAADRMQELQLRAMDARATAAERFAAQKEIAQMQLEGKKDMVHLAAALRPAPAPHTSIAYGPDGKGYLVDMRTGAQSPLESIGKAPANTLKNLPVKAQTEWSALQNLDSATKAYEALLKDYDPQSKDALNLEKRNAVKAAFTDLQMRQKEAFGLGAITGPDMQILEGAYTDPTGVAGMLKGGLTGTKAFTAQIDQGRAALHRTKRNFEQQYKVELPDPAGTTTAPMPGAGSGGFKILGVRDK